LESKSYEIEKKSALSPKWIAFALLWGALSFVVMEILHTQAPWWIYIAFFPLPMIVWLTVFSILERFNVRFKLKPNEWALLFTIMFSFAGCYYGFTGSDGAGWWTVPYAGQHAAAVGYFLDPYRNYWSKLLPSFMAPPESEARAYFYGGLFNLSAWLPSMMFWAAWAIIWYVGGLFWSFWLRKPLVEVEKLPFVEVIPSRYLIVWDTKETTSGKKFLFDISQITTKLFWIGVIIGFLLVLPDVLAFWAPMPTIRQLYFYTIDLRPFTDAILPGAGFVGTIATVQLGIFYLVPLDFLLTSVLLWVITSVIYPVVGVVTGILPYQAGASPQSLYGYTTGPFKFMVWGSLSAIGIGIAMIWMNRVHFAKILRSLFGTSEYEEGISYKVIALGSIIFFVLATVIQIIAGVPAIPALFWTIWWILFMYGWIREQGDVQEFMTDTPQYIPQAYDVGVLSGAWGPPPSPKSFSAVFLWGPAFGGARMQPATPVNQFKVYRIASDFGLAARDVFIVTAIIIVFMAIFGSIFHPWFQTIVGGASRASGIIYGQWGLGTVQTYTYGTVTGPTSLEQWLYIISGVVVVLACYYLRARYAWFFINPSAFVAMYVLNSWWYNTVIALVLKYLTLKIGGSKAYESYGVPLAVGYTVGYGLGLVVIGGLAFFLIALPKLLGV
jgi:hypothetical protein